MKVHVFGNSPSPSVATYGLRRTADQAESKIGSDVEVFVDFYVDDALSSHILCKRRLPYSYSPVLFRFKRSIASSAVG
jgi:hypothetical protein